MPKLFSFLLVNIAVGILASWVLLAGLLYVDIGGLGRLVAGSPDGLVAFGMLAVGFAVTFGGAAAATAVLMMRYEYDDTGSTTTYRLKRAVPHQTGKFVPVNARKGVSSSL